MLIAADLLGLLYPWLIVGLSLLGARWASSADRATRKRGFSIWIISNGLIGIDYLHTGSYPQALLFLIGYQYYNLRGVLNNRKEVHQS